MGLKTFRVIALGEFIPTKMFMDPILGLINPEKDEDDEDDEGAAAGTADEDKPSANVLENMGTMLFLLILFIFALLIAAIIIKSCKEGSFCRKKAEGIKKKFFWNGAIRYVLQSYLKTAMGATAALVLVSWEGG